MIERINGFAARRFGVGTTAGSFVRIHVWAVGFLVVLSLVLPAHAAQVATQFTKNPSVENLALDVNDPRGFARSPFGKVRFRIAWITGSEGDITDVNYREFLPSLITKQLAGINGRRIGVDAYVLDGMRAADDYFTLLDVIQSKPDMIVMSLNPTWITSPMAIHQSTQLDSRAAVQLLSKPTSWPLAAGLLSPSDLAWGLANSAFQPLENRQYYSNRIHKLFDDFGPLSRDGRAAALAVRKPDRSQLILGMLPVNFWFQYRLHEPRAWHSAIQWARWMERASQVNSGINKLILRAIATELRDSKIPSYVYDAPVNSQWLATNSEFAAAVGGVERHLEQFRSNFAARNIRYQPLSATRFVPPLAFHDVMHLRRAGPMGPYLAGELCQLISQVGYKSAGCARRSETSNGA